MVLCFLLYRSHNGCGVLDLERIEAGRVLVLPNSGVAAMFMITILVKAEPFRFQRVFGAWLSKPQAWGA